MEVVRGKSEKCKKTQERYIKVNKKYKKKEIFVYIMYKESETSDRRG